MRYMLNISLKEVLRYKLDLSDYDKSPWKETDADTTASFDPSRIHCKGMQINFQLL